MFKFEMHSQKEQARTFKVPPNHGLGRQRDLLCACPRHFFDGLEPSAGEEKCIDGTPMAFLGTALFLMS